MSLCTGAYLLRSNYSIDWEDEVSCKFQVFMLKSLMQHCETKGGSYHDCVLLYLGKLNIKSNQTWIDELTSYGNQRGDVNENTGSEDGGIHGEFQKMFVLCSNQWLMLSN